MKRFLSLLLLLAAPLAWGATGDIIGADVRTDGWTMNLYIEGYTAPAAGDNRWDITWATNNSSSSSIVLTVGSPGFNKSGASNYVTRTIYGTRGMRNPWYGHTNEMSEAVGSDLKTTVALSSRIYYGDTITAMSIGSGVYSNNAACSSFTPTNNSTMGYPLTVGGWTWPCGQLWRATTGRLRAFAINGHAANGRPVECLKFITTGCTSGVKQTNIATLTIDRTLPDPIPTGEYIADIPLTPFNNYELVRCDIQAFPRIGITNLLDTTADVYLWPTNYPCAVTNRVDTNNTYCSTVAVVDPTVGNDSNGRAGTNGYAELVSGNLCFSNIFKAAAFCAATNNTFFGHNDNEGTVIYLRSTVTNWTGGSATINQGRTWVTVMPYPGDAWPTLTNGPGDGRIGANQLTHFLNINFTGPTEANMIADSGSGAMWFDQCILAPNPTAGFATAMDANYWTHCNFSNSAVQIPSAGNQVPTLVRGNTNTAYAQTRWGQMVIGNTRTSTNIMGGIWSIAASTTYPCDFGVFYNNIELGHRHSTSLETFKLNDAGVPDLGYAFVQNVFEYVTNSVIPGMTLCCNINEHFTNLIVFNNTILGEKFMIAYEDTGSTARYRELFSIKNNVIDDLSLKTDCTSPFDTNRIGNWAVANGVDHEGNVWLETTGMGTAGSFVTEFSGLNSGSPNSLIPPTSVSTRATNYIAFVDRQANDGATALMTGIGNYRLQSASPGLLLKTTWILPFDIEGNARSESDPPGAYCSANPRKAAGFF